MVFPEVLGVVGEVVEGEVVVKQILSLILEVMIVQYFGWMLGSILELVQHLSLILKVMVVNYLGLILEVLVVVELLETEHKKPQNIDYVTHDRNYCMNDDAGMCNNYCMNNYKAFGDT